MPFETSLHSLGQQEDPSGREEKTSSKGSSERLSFEIDAGNDKVTEQAIRAYLSSSLGRVLANCMFELCELQPEDPIEFMARWLYRYSDNQIYLQEKADFLQRSAAVMSLLAQEKRQRQARMKAALGTIKSLRASLTPSTMAMILGQGVSILSKGASAIMDEDQWAVLKDCPPLAGAPDMIEMRGRLTKYQNLSSTRRRHSAPRDGEYDDGKTGSKGSRRTSRYAGENGDARGRGDDSLASSSMSSSLSDEDDDAREERYMRWEQRQEEKRRLREERQAGRNQDDAERKRHAHWRLDQHGRMVCLHPLLGRLVGHGSSQRLDDMESWLSGELACPSWYDHEIYACLPESMLYVSPEHVEPEEPEVEEPDTQEQVSAQQVSRVGVDILAKSQASGQVVPSVTFSSVGPDSATVVALGDEEDEDDDDVRWRACNGDEDGVCESWKICEGFPQRPPSDDQK